MTPQPLGPIDLHRGLMRLLRDRGASGDVMVRCHAVYEGEHCYEVYARGEIKRVLARIFHEVIGRRLNVHQTGWMLDTSEVGMLLRTSFKEASVSVSAGQTQP